MCGQIDFDYGSYGGSYLNAVERGCDTTIEPPPDTKTGSRNDYSGIVAHAKGYRVMIALEAVLGESVFGRVRQRCLDEF